MFYSLSRRGIYEDVKGKYILQELGRQLGKFLLCACAPHMGFQVVFGAGWILQGLTSGHRAAAKINYFGLQSIGTRMKVLMVIYRQASKTTSV